MTGTCPSCRQRIEVRPTAGVVECPSCGKRSRVMEREPEPTTTEPSWLREPPPPPPPTETESLPEYRQATRFADAIRPLRRPKAWRGTEVAITLTAAPLALLLPALSILFIRSDNPALGRCGAVLGALTLASLIVGLFFLRMKTVGTLLIVAGTIGVLCALGMDVSVPSDGGVVGRVNNLGLMQDRQNCLLLSAVAFLSGVILSGFGAVRDEIRATATR
ncbi:MAG: hypothetical protein LLG00_05025 [Planctomycetaceae bacterium]|nr:hypothetical protein [Planctomycetaceae bacterium]